MVEGKRDYLCELCCGTENSATLQSTAKWIILLLIKKQIMLWTYSKQTATLPDIQYQLYHTLCSYLATKLNSALLIIVHH